jgi:hypothetical protein
MIHATGKAAEAAYEGQRSIYSAARKANMLIFEAAAIFIGGRRASRWRLRAKPDVEAGPKTSGVSFKRRESQRGLSMKTLRESGR